MRNWFKILLFACIGVVMFSAIDGIKLIKKIKVENIERVEIEENEIEVSKKKSLSLTFFSYLLFSFLSLLSFLHVSRIIIKGFYSEIFNFYIPPKKFLLHHQWRICS